MTEAPKAPSFKAVALRGSVLVIASQAFRLFLTFASLVVLSRLLSPEDFGLVACLTPIVAFVNMFQDGGMQQAVIQKPTLSNEQLNRIFWVLVVIGAVSTSVLALASPLIVSFYGDERLLALTVVFSTMLILSSAANLPNSLLNRQMRFEALAGIDCAAGLAGFLASLIGALAGLGYWSLIAGPIATVMVSAILSLWASGWRPGRPNLRISRDIFDFGANLTGFNIVNFFARNLDNVLIGRTGGAAALGYYDRAYKLLLFPLMAVNYPLSRVIVPILSRVQNDTERFRAIYIRMIGLVTLALAPGVAAALMVPHEVITLMFGEKWLPVVPIYCWLGLAGLIQTATSTSGWIFVALGKTKQMFRWGIFASFVSVTAFCVGLPWGATGVAAAYALSEYLINLPALCWYIGRATPIRGSDFLRVLLPLLASALLGWILVHFVILATFTLPPLGAIAVALGVSYAMAAALMMVTPFGRETLHEAFSLALKLLRKRKL